jgi:plastocyanin domain-containing protein
MLTLALAAPAAVAAKKDVRVIELKATETGFAPDHIEVPAGSYVTLRITRTTDNTCAKEIKIKSRKIKKALPLNKPVTVQLGKVTAGKITFACGMNMMTGHILVQ